ncbi:hypothetical protein THAOC_05086 [Thalassiosira oceanica]|uniref:Uncharacterized protein n=1 Tax=Thalassiosira oceanica TaxID=159749 RepID=K0TN91_THAOC|nr:hypothetical protein THAOC_05086 [Thalassiosira oceanica]|eukprot:EJK73297.1 hypothetical protein THAOC_05086 [Thalassiosira oceanica]
MNGDVIAAAAERHWLPLRSQFCRAYGLLLGAILAPLGLLPARHGNATFLACCHARRTAIKTASRSLPTTAPLLPRYVVFQARQRTTAPTKKQGDNRACGTNTMPNKKKERGRKNRAKKEATRTADRRGQWEPMLAANNNGVSCCEHMLAVSPKIPQEGPAVSFMNHMAGEGFFNKTALFPDAPAMEICFNSLSLCFPGVEEEGSERALAIELLLRFLRNVFVRDSNEEGEKWFNQRRSNEVVICCMIDLLELFGASPT